MSGKTSNTVSVSPLAPKKLARLPDINGVAVCTASSGTRYGGRDDVLLMRFPKATKVAGVFTRSQMPSAAVDVSRRHLSGGRARGLVVNAGNANAFTGKAGDKAALAMAKGAARLIGCATEDVFVASTGVIGEALDPKPLIAALEKADNKAADRAKGEADWQQAAQAIMTTDTFPKLATQQAKFGKHQITLNGFVKGSGMIAPDMATMLAFIVTDAALPAGLLQKLLRTVNADTFNCVTVDSDTSTSDTCLLFATGEKALGGAPLRTLDDRRLKPLRQALAALMQDLAMQLAGDGEGISKLMTIEVTGAASDAAARRIALAIGNSPLVKTAVAGEDANWGRIVMAVGKSGEAASRDRLAISIGGVRVAKNGRVVAGYKEAPVARHMKGRQISICVDVGIGKGRARIWASDLTHDYVSINADYRS